MLTKNSLVLITAIAISPWTTACSTLECGDGTSEVDGVCEPDGTKSPEEPENCGPFTHYDATTMSCVPDYKPTECDPSTSQEVCDEVTGVCTCVGTGVGGCDSTFLCPAPTEGKVTVCGQLFNVEDNTYLRADGAGGTFCDPASPTADGPCSTKILFYDAVEFATNPDTASPLASGDIEIDDCGRFRGPDISFPTQAPFIGIAIDNVAGTGMANGPWARTGVAVEVSPNQRLNDTRSYAVKFTTIDMWTTSSGVDFGGDSFWDRGVYVPLFMSGEPVLDPDDPGNNVPKRVAGVTITAGGSPAATRDWYFSDTDANMLTTVDAAQNVTGANGAGLMIDSTLVMHSGTGGEPAGCEWPSNLAAAIPTVAFIQERIAEKNDGSGDVCE